MSKKILIIGDSCTDVFVYGDINRICPEAPVPVLKPTHTTENGGMSKNVQRNIKVLGCDTNIITNDNDLLLFVKGEKKWPNEVPSEIIELLEEYILSEAFRK